MSECNGPEDNAIVLVHTNIERIVEDIKKSREQTLKQLTDILNDDDWAGAWLSIFDEELFDELKNFPWPKK